MAVLTNSYYVCFILMLVLQVRLKCLQTLRSLFAHPERNVATPYIHMLAPRVMECLYAEESKTPQSDVELAAILESIQIVDTLISLTETKNRKLISHLLIFFLLFLLYMFH